jgi:CheY-like chemotaxis protein
MPTHATKRLLTYNSPALATLIRDLLGEAVSVVEAASLEEAVNKLESETFDAFLSGTAQFPVFARRGRRSEAEMILDMIGHGVCTVSHNGRLHWSNPKFRSYPQAAQELVRQTAASMCGDFAATTAGEDMPPPRHRSLTVGGEFHYDLTASPIYGDSGQFERLVIVVSDMSASRKLGNTIDAIDAAGRELVRLDVEAQSEMDVSERLALLEEKIVRYCRDLLNFQHFNIRIRDKKTDRLDVLLSQGMSTAARQREIYARTEGNGISGYVAATGRSYICPDVERDARFLPSIDNARSALTVPLRLHDSIIGTLSVESDHVAAFGEDDRQFAEILARYIAIALNILQLLEVERHATTGQVTEDVIAELGAPLNDIVTTASAIIEDYIGHDDLRKRLHEIINSVDGVKRRIAGLRSSSKVSGLVDAPQEIDPVLGEKRILIADDEDTIRETIAAVLDRAGAITVMAADGEEAIRAINSQHFDLVISDINMPHKTGYEVFSTAKQIHPDCEVLLITGFGYDPNHSIVRASREGLAGVVFKPFKVDLLMKEARKALGGPETPNDTSSGT